MSNAITISTSNNSQDPVLLRLTRLLTPCSHIQKNPNVVYCENSQIDSTFVIGLSIANGQVHNPNVD